VFHEKQIIEVLERILHALGRLDSIERTLHRIEHEIHRNNQPITAAIAVQFTGDSIMANNALVLNVGQTSQASIQPLLADGVTPSGGVLSAVSYTFTDPSATVVINADGLTATVTGVAASTGAVTGSASATVTDTDGVVSTWTQTFTITTNAVTPPPPAQLTQSIAVQFSTPTP
jgi:hypothetical protein